MDFGTWTGASVDPALPYLLFATALLAAVAVTAGALRRDHRALRRRTTLIKLAASLALAAAIAFATHLLASNPPTDAAVWGRLGGLSRLPLWIVTLAYGPSVGVVTGLGYLAAFAVFGGLDATAPVLVVELAVLGWLSIYPSPLRHRWAGPVNAIGAYALAWGTAGLMQVYAAGHRVTWQALAQQHEDILLGALIAAVTLFAFGPGAYRRWFPEAALHRERGTAPETQT